MLYIKDLQNICTPENIAISKHAAKRLNERDISVEDVINAINIGEIIRQYEDDKPFPSCLVLGKANNEEYIHIVASIDNNFLHIITAYYPDINIWDDDFRTKRRL